MSIIQSLREKGAWIMTAFIAFALLVFVVEEGLKNKSIFGGSSNTLGKVNGTTIDRVKFEERFKQLEDRYTQMGYTMDPNTAMQQRNSLWDEFVSNAILDEEYDKLGLEVTDKELGDFLYGSNPPQDFLQRFTDPNTGQFDANQAYQTVQQIRKQKGSPDYENFFGNYLPALVKFRKREKLDALMNNSVYVPKWLIEKTTAENNQIASISYVSVPYITIPDTTVKVSDAEITEYVNKHKALFKQEKAAGIDYVYFSAAPSATDSAAILLQLQNLKDSFSTTNDVAQFLLSNSSQVPYYDSYIARKEIKMDKIDSIIATPAGSIYGPYLDGGSYVMSRVVAVKPIPETVKVRHILVATMQQTQTGQMQQVRDDLSAKNLIDSIATAIRTGSNFDTLCKKFSDDGNKDQGGIYDSVVSGRMVPSFNDFIFTNAVGTKGVVKTEYGYHYVEVLSRKGATVNGYKIAYLSFPILVSDETDNIARSAAFQFATESRDRKSFEENAKKLGKDIFNAAEIKPLDASVRGVGLETPSRELVRWIFNEASLGQVSDRAFSVGSNYMVPIVTQLYAEGIKDAKQARPNTEYTIRQEKKAKLIAEKMGTPASLEALAQTMNVPVLNADSVSFSSPQITGVGYEPKVAGAAFNKANQSALSKPISGTAGVFVLKTISVGAVANPNMDVRNLQTMQQTQMRMMLGQRGNIAENLKKKASIKDERYKYF